MGFAPDPSYPCVKGPIPHCLDEVSKGADARRRLEQLRDAITSIAPSYQGLETVFDTYLLVYVFDDPRVRENIVAHLKTHWFDDSSPDAYFPNQRVAAIYAQGVLKALEFSLKGPEPIPLNAWWILDLNEVKMLTLVEIDPQGITVDSRVTLLILTPRPRGEVRSDKPIFGDLAQAWVSELAKGQVVTRRVELPPKP